MKKDKAKLKIKADSDTNQPEKSLKKTKRIHKQQNANEHGQRMKNKNSIAPHPSKGVSSVEDLNRSHGAQGKLNSGTINKSRLAKTSQEKVKSGQNKLGNNNLPINNSSTTPDSNISYRAWSLLTPPLNPLLLQSLLSNGFPSMLPIQQASIPLLLKNYDLAIEAQTGSGKTLAFVVPVIERMIREGVVGNEGVKGQAMEEELQKQLQGDGGLKEQADTETNKHKKAAKLYEITYLVIAPTRQLIYQTYQVFQQLIRGIQTLNGQTQLNSKSTLTAPFSYCAAGGLTSLPNDLQALKMNKTYILFSTIGRLKEIMLSKTIRLNKVQHLFIDEADRVLKQKGVEVVLGNNVHGANAQGYAVQKLRRTTILSATLGQLTTKEVGLFGMRNMVKIGLKRGTSNGDNAKEVKLETNDEGNRKNDERSIMTPDNGNSMAKLQSNNVYPNNKPTQHSLTTQSSPSQPMYTIPKSLSNSYISFSCRFKKILYLQQLIKQVILVNSSNGTNSPKLKVIVFMNTCHQVQYYGKLFNECLKMELIANNTHNTNNTEQYYIIPLHGRLKPHRRTKLLDEFKSSVVSVNSSKINVSINTSKVNVSVNSSKISKINAQIGQQPTSQQQNCSRNILFSTDVVSRGIDFSYIDYIIQLDAPTDPDNYVHRIGRTARVDRRGVAVLLMNGQKGLREQGPMGINCQDINNQTEQKDRHPFIIYLENRGIPLIQLNSHEPNHILALGRAKQFITNMEGEIGGSAKMSNIPKNESHKKHKSTEIVVPKTPQLLYSSQIHTILHCLLCDRDLIEKSKKSYVSYIRAYQQHSLKYLFPLKELDLGDLANSMFLLRVPRVKEILGRKLGAWGWWGGGHRLGGGEDNIELNGVQKEGKGAQKIGDNTNSLKLATIVIESCQHCTGILSSNHNSANCIKLETAKYENRPTNVNIDLVAWKDKNQQLQFNNKKDDESRGDQRTHLPTLPQSAKIAKPVRDIKNKKSLRRKIKRSNEYDQYKEMAKEHKSILKSRKRGRKNIQMSSDQQDDMMVETG